MAFALRTHSLTKRITEGRHERTILDDLSIEVATGEMVALLGPSGSGKSTLLNLIAGIDLPSSGRIEILDTDVSALDDSQRTLFRRRHIGLVFQSFQLLPTLTVEENVLLPLDLDGRGGRDARARAADLCAQVGLGDRRAAMPEVLSGGEQQRVALARAVVMQPQLVLADEPTGSLDEKNAEAVLDLLDRLRQRERCAILLATHGRRAAARCDRALRLADGRLAGQELADTAPDAAAR